jgi:predicted transcriptional regulator
MFGRNHDKTLRSAAAPQANFKSVISNHLVRFKSASPSASCFLCSSKASSIRPRLAGSRTGCILLNMEVQFTSDQQAKLTRMAAEQGRAAETLVQEAVERFLNYDEWFSLEVDKGLAAADRGEFVEHDDIRKMIDSRYPA